MVVFDFTVGSVTWDLLVQEVKQIARMAKRSPMTPTIAFLIVQVGFEFQVRCLAEFQARRNKLPVLRSVLLEVGRESGDPW